MRLHKRRDRGHWRAIDSRRWDELVFVALRSLLGRLAYSFHHSMSQDFAQRRVPPFSYEQPRSRVAYESVHLEQLSGAPFPPPTHHFAIGKGRSQGGSLVDAVRVLSH